MLQKWRNRDSPSSQEKTGMLWALLKANCQFEILFEKDGLCTDEQTIWIRVVVAKISPYSIGMVLI